MRLLFAVSLLWPAAAAAEVPLVGRLVMSRLPALEAVLPKLSPAAAPLLTARLPADFPKRLEALESAAEPFRGLPASMLLLAPATPAEARLQERWTAELDRASKAAYAGVAEARQKAMSDANADWREDVHSLSALMQLQDELALLAPLADPAAGLYQPATREGLWFQESIIEGMRADFSSKKKGPRFRVVLPPRRDLGDHVFDELVRLDRIAVILGKGRYHPFAQQREYPSRRLRPPERPKP